jgi:hypothetical protein
MDLDGGRYLPLSFCLVLTARTLVGSRQGAALAITRERYY